MAVVNPSYEFTFVDIGNAGRQSDGGVFAASDLGFALEQGVVFFRINQERNSLYSHNYVSYSRVYSITACLNSKNVYL